MNFYRAAITMRGTIYVHYLMVPSIHHAKLQMIHDYGRRIGGDGKYKPVAEVPEFKKVCVELHDGRSFSFIEMVCNLEHAQVLCYQKYKFKNCKKVWVEIPIGPPMTS